jgi:hypothetical protein
MKLFFINLLLSTFITIHSYKSDPKVSNNGDFDLFDKSTMKHNGLSNKLIKITLQTNLFRFNINDQAEEVKSLKLEQDEQKTKHRKSLVDQLRPEGFLKTPLGRSRSTSQTTSKAVYFSEAKTDCDITMFKDMGYNGCNLIITYKDIVYMWYKSLDKNSSFGLLVNRENGTIIELAVHFTKPLPMSVKKRLDSLFIVKQSMLADRTIYLTQYSEMLERVVEWGKVEMEKIKASTVKKLFELHNQIKQLEMMVPRKDSIKDCWSKKLKYLRQEFKDNMKNKKLKKLFWEVKEINGVIDKMWSLCLERACSHYPDVLDEEKYHDSIEKQKQYITEQTNLLDQFKVILIKSFNSIN